MCCINWSTRAALGHLQDHEALLCTQDVGYFTNLHRKNPLFKLLGELTPGKTSNWPSLRRRWPVGVGLGEIGKRTTLLSNVAQSLGFMVRCGDLCQVIRQGSTDQHFAKTDSVALHRERTVVSRVRLCCLW